MNPDVILYILIAGMAFIAGVAVTLVVAERSFAARARRQALRERELKEVNAIVNDRLAWLAGDPRISSGRQHHHLSRQVVPQRENGRN